MLFKEIMFDRLANGTRKSLLHSINNDIGLSSIELSKALYDIRWKMRLSSLSNSITTQLGKKHE